MTAWSVLIEARGDGDVDPAALDRFAEAVAPHEGATTGGPGSWSARVTVYRAGADLAASFALRLVSGLARDAGLAAWPVVRAEATRWDVFEEDIAAPQLPELVSAPEAAEILGVSPQRVHVLAAQHKDFPRAAYRLRSGKIWLRAAIVGFDARWDRTPGRPRKQERGTGSTAPALRPGSGP